MTDENTRVEDRRDETDALAVLIRAAGSREDPPQEYYDSVFAVASEVWTDKIRRRRRKVSLAWAAGIAVVAFLTTWIVRYEAVTGPPVQVAMTDRILGVVEIRGVSDDGWRSISTSELAIAEGTRIRTGTDSRLGLLLTDRVSLRLNESTEILLESASRIHLDAGAVYVDSGADPMADRVTEIVTANGVARDIGTQFEVDVRDSVVRLRVREGRVMFRQQEDEIDSAAGEQLVIGQQGEPLRSVIAPDADEWHWVQTVAPAPYANEQSVSKLVRWVSRETGRQIHFSRQEVRDRAATTILHGSKQRLLPMEALSVMLETTDFEYVVTADREILIQER